MDHKHEKNYSNSFHKTKRINKTTLTCHLSKMTRTQKFDNGMSAKMHSTNCWWECELVQPLWKTC